MNPRNEVSAPEKNVAQPAKRARLDSLLFGGALPGRALAAIKWPEAYGE